MSRLLRFKHKCASARYGAMLSISSAFVRINRVALLSLFRLVAVCAK